MKGLESVNLTPESKVKTIAARAYLYLLLGMTSFIAGCNVDFAIPANESMHLSIYKAGQPILERTLDSNDLVRETISRWLAANPNGWEYAFITREPQIYVTGKHFSIDVLTNEVEI